MHQDVIREYYIWLSRFISTGNRVEEYSSTLKRLYEIPYTYILWLDENRYKDSLSFRKKFTQWTGLEITEQGWPVSVFEMMVALAYRCEEQIMGSDDFGDRTPLWFWSMFENLGLLECSEIYEIDDRVHRALIRDFPPNGQGSFWSVKNPHLDCRKVDIWLQMNWWLGENYPD